jgi:hypothetical protein
MAIKVKYSRCIGCIALMCSDTEFTCKLGVKVEFVMSNGKAISPKPSEKCFKPKTQEEFDKANSKQLK